MTRDRSNSDQRPPLRMGAGAAVPAVVAALMLVGTWPGRTLQQGSDLGVVQSLYGVGLAELWHRLRPPPDPPLARFVATEPAQAEVSFATEDGGTVFADVYGAGEHGVVLAHGGRFTKESWSRQAPVLAAAGFRVVAIDFRGRGQSRGGPRSGTGDEGVQHDVLAAVRYLRETGAISVSVVGASFGGWAAAQAAVEAGPGGIDRIVLLAHSSIDEPERIPGRKLFIVTGGDAYGSGALRLPDIRDQFERAPEPKELLVLAGTAHAQFVFESAEGPRLLREILRFLSDR